MTNSRNFNELRKRLSELRKHLLPKTFSPTGDYTDRQIDRARGYRLLAHAEIEAYLEDFARETVIKRVSDWKAKSLPNIVVIALCAYHASLSKDEKRNTSELSSIIDKAVETYIRNLKSNHDIREENLRNIIQPVGLLMSDLDPTWIINLDEFGKLRGDVAHQSNKTTGRLNPEDEYQRVSQIIQGLRALDQKLYEICNQ